MHVVCTAKGVYFFPACLTHLGLRWTCSERNIPTSVRRYQFQFYQEFAITNHLKHDTQLMILVTYYMYSHPCSRHWCSPLGSPWTQQEVAGQCGYHHLTNIDREIGGDSEGHMHTIVNHIHWWSIDIHGSMRWHTCTPWIHSSGAGDQQQELTLATQTQWRYFGGCSSVCVGVDIPKRSVQYYCV